MNKKLRQQQRESLAKAISPPSRRSLDDLLDEYADPIDSAKPNQTQLSSAQPDSAQLSSTPQTIVKPKQQPSSAQLSSTQLSSAQPIAPERDFNKRANSLERNALPAGMFPNSSKKLYDALYIRTRGAHTPTRTIKATRKEVMKWANIGGRNTLAAALEYLETVGLVKKHFIIGDQMGAIYEVFLPEEANLPDSAQLSSAQLSSTPFRVLDSASKWGRAELGQLLEQKGDSRNLKTSFKTIDDDDIAELFFAPIRAIAEQIGGDTATTNDRWCEVGKLLAEELQIAAARAGQINNVPAFFAEHLRRALGRAGKSKHETTKKEPKPRSGQTKEERLKKIIDETRVLHVGDGNYTEHDLFEDVIFKAKRAGIDSDEKMLRTLMNII
jgi:hypothetical protein